MGRAGCSVRRFPEKTFAQVSEFSRSMTALPIPTVPPVIVPDRRNQHRRAAGARRPR